MWDGGFFSLVPKVWQQAVAFGLKDIGDVYNKLSNLLELHLSLQYARVCKVEKVHGKKENMWWFWKVRFRRVSECDSMLKITECGVSIPFIKCRFKCNARICRCVL
jgi:hypothetical protein